MGKKLLEHTYSKRPSCKAISSHRRESVWGSNVLHSGRGRHTIDLLENIASSICLRRQLIPRKTSMVLGVGASTNRSRSPTGEPNGDVGLRLEVLENAASLPSIFAFHSQNSRQNLAASSAMT